MKLSLRTIGLATAMAIASITSAHAQDTGNPEFLAATGIEGGTYNTVHNQWQKVCSAFKLPTYKVDDAKTKQKRNSNGTVENLQALLSNQADMAYVQADAVWSFLQRDPNVQNLRVLAVLYPEAVHVITKSAPIKVKVAGKVFGTNDAEKTLNSVADLKGLSVAAWGGSATTADIIDKFILGGVSVVEVSGKDEAFQKLNSGEVQAIVAVGGYPVKWVEDLDRNFKLLPFPKTLRDKVGSSYADAKLTYTKMGAAGVESGETTSMLVAQNFGKKKAKALTEAFDCMVENYEDLRDTRGMHPAWKKVDFNRTSTILPKFPFVRDATPAAAPAPAAKASAKKK